MEAKVYWRREKAAVLPSPAAPRRSCPVPVMRLTRRIAVTGHDRRRRERTSRMMPAEENEFAAVLLIDAAMVACNFRFVYLEWGGGCCRFGSGQRFLYRSLGARCGLSISATPSASTSLNRRGHFVFVRRTKDRRISTNLQRHSLQNKLVDIAPGLTSHRILSCLSSLDLSRSASGT